MPYAAQQQQPIYPPPHIPPQVQGVAPLRHYNHHTAPQEYNQHAPPQGYNRDVSPPHYPPVPPPHPSSSSPQAPNLYGPYYMDSTTGQMIPFAPQTFPPQHQPSQQQPQHMPIQRTAQVVPAPALQWEHRPYAQAVLYDGGSRQESERPQPPQMISPHPIYPHSQPLHGKQNELQPTPAATSSFQSPALSPVSTLSNHNQAFASHAPSSGLPLRFSGPPVATSIMNGPPDNHLPYTHRPASSASVSSSSTSRTASSSNRPGGSSISGSSSSVSISGLELLPMRATSKYPRKKVKPMKEEKTNSSATQNGGADEKETSLITNPPFLPAKPTWVEQEPSLPPKKESKRRMPGNLPPLASNGRQPHSEPNILYQPFGPQPHNHAPNAVGMPMPNFAPPLPMYYNTFQQQQQVQLGCEVDNPPRRSESGRKLWEPRQMS
ncbi:hypothetical protein BT69DRAFT_1272 [Atractiella rhizophila]|nr:hypothetical protein BT69DRAFT_1272 [Atractiella rhizophila]